MAPDNSARMRKKRSGSTNPVEAACWMWFAVAALFAIHKTATAARFRTAPRLDKGAIERAEFYATALWTGPSSVIWWDSFTEGSIPAMPWYRKIIVDSEPRYDAMVLLLITRPVETPIGNDGKKSKLAFKDSASCTAFYISPDTLMTVAHCLRDTNVSKGSGHIIIARQNFVAQRDKVYTKELADNYERIVVEWIYEEAYCKMTSVWNCEESADYAFLKIDGTSHNNAHYTIATPKADGADKYDYIGTHASVVIAGFPGEWSKFNEPAEVEGVLHYTTDDEFKKEPGVAYEIKKFGKKRELALATLRDNQIAAVSHGKGTMGFGGSGGPWLIAEKTLTKEQKTARLRWVIGLSLWSSGIPTEEDMPNLSWVERQKLATVAISKLFTKEFVEMAKKVAAIKDGAKTMESVMADHIK